MQHESASPLVELLKALAHGRCTPDLWERGVVAHYGCVSTEAARSQLVRASIDAGDWECSAVPAEIINKAITLLAITAPSDGARALNRK